MDKILCALAVLCAVGIVIIGFIAKPIITGVTVAIIAVVGWHDDYYIAKKNRR